MVLVYQIKRRQKPKQKMKMKKHSILNCDPGLETSLLNNAVRWRKSSLDQNRVLFQL